jgi:hypothetical protein
MERTDIVNARSKLLIEAPEQLTKRTRRKNACHCVFAEACNRLPNVDEAIIHVSTAYIRFKGHKHFTRYRVHTTLRDQIVIFDRFGVFDPGSALQPSHQARGQRQGGNSNGQTKKAIIRPRKVQWLQGVRAPANIATL